jgi:division protein CdvB (Snf7/Vps24/ESCRT-III family)
MHNSSAPHSDIRLFTGFACLATVSLLSTNVLAQSTTPTRNPFQTGAALQNSIGNEIVQRQSEILRVDTTTSQLESRISRIERQLLSTYNYPAMTIAEAEAALTLAVAQHDEMQNQAGEPTTVQLATAQLAIARAEGQLQIARVSRAENLILSKLDVITAEREFLLKGREYAFQQRLAAKGHTRLEALTELQLGIDAAQQKLELMRLRLETLRKLGGMSGPDIEKDAPLPPPTSKSR